MLERSLILFGSYAFQAASCIVCLLLFLSLKKDIHRLRTRLTRQDFTVRLAAMNARLEEAEARSSVPAPTVAAHSLNLSKRSQVIRLSRRGERPDTIAAALGLPRREVELLLKVHHAAVASAGGATS